jgi:dipeptidyl aminopeptidase/acylaminoacyl peptidase
VFANSDVDFAGLLRVSAAGGTPQRLTMPEAGGRHSYPSFLPGGQAIVFAAMSRLAGEAQNASIVARRLDTGEQRVVFSGASQPRYVAPGHLVATRAGTLLAIPFDAARLETIGPAAAVVQGVMSGGSIGGVAQYDVSRTGHLVYATGPSAVADREVVWVNRRGEATPIEGLRRPVNEATLSPDGRRIAVSLIGENQNIWTFDLASGTFSRLSFGKGFDQFPRWTPDGRRIAYSSTQNGPYEVYWKAADGSGAEERLVKADVPGQFPRSWSPDGRWLLFQRGTTASANDLWVMSPDGREKARPFVATPANETAAEFSPDGRWVTYESNETGIPNVFVQAFPGPGGKWQISTDGGARPRWRRDGRELFYRTREAVMGVPVTTGTTFTAGRPQEVVRGTYEVAFDASPDGQRFLMIRSGTTANSAQLHVVLNWTEDLKSGHGRN